MSKELTPAVRSTYEGHKNSVKKKPVIKREIKEATPRKLKEKGTHRIDTPEEYVKYITLDEEIALGTFLEKIIRLGSSQGFVAFMMLYKYMFDHELLGEEVAQISGQEVINHIYGKKKYKLKPKDKQAFLCAILQLSGLQFSMESYEKTQALRKQKGKEDHFEFTSFTLLKVKGHQTLKNKETITFLIDVTIMKDFVDLWDKKVSKLFIPLEDILQISHDSNGDHRRGFNLAVALRHAELGSTNDTLMWDLNYCLNAGQWDVESRRKSEAWEKIIQALEDGKKQELIDYQFIYEPGKPQENRYIKKVAIKRLWQTYAHPTKLGIKPERIIPRSRRKSQAIVL